MNTKTCYSCKCALVDISLATPGQIEGENYASEEHIIPNFCGGHLKSEILLCRKCNNSFGTELERELSKQLVLARLIPFKLDRGKQEGLKIIGETENSKEEVLVDNKLQFFFKKPSIIFSEDKKSLSIRGKSIEEVKHILIKQKKKFPNLDINEALKRIEKKEIYLEELVYFRGHTFGGKLGHRAIAKIALNFYLANGGDLACVEEVRKYVCEPDIENNFIMFYYPIYPIHNLGKNEISHVLYLKGDSKKKLLYCYIELFNTTNFLVILNNDYEGENFTKAYSYNLLYNSEILDKKINLTLFRNPFDDLKYKNGFDKYLHQLPAEFKSRVERVYRIIENLN